ncbi:MAG: UDP-2,4-diacetamido-2,4,6-trideoxy-beta-L-altropyranose hydrolase [Actinomycetota bacterium]|nr:UDP-2,4-diacetamido-2,4,6-trideoxy-beta-L-altropyranose hydrolase [Actinomycetota bacterium]
MNLWIRADGSPTIGMGHVMRTLALAEEAELRGISARYVIRDNDVVRRLLERRGFPSIGLRDASSEGWLTEVSEDDALVFDGYDFGAADIRAASATGGRVGLIDDGGGGEFLVDAVLNQSNMRANYTIPNNENVLVGPRHALIRSEFRRRRRERMGGTRTLGVVMGGADVAGLGAVIVDLLEAHRPFEEVVLLEGPAAPARPPDRIPWLSVVRDPVDPSEVLDGCDAVISTAGVSTWELLFMGIPAALILVAENQRPVVESVRDTDTALVVGAAEDVSRRLGSVLDEMARIETQRRLSRAGLDLVDGGGAGRFLDALTASGNRPR